MRLPETLRSMAAKKRSKSAPMPGGRNVGVTRNRVFRCSDELWEAARAKAKANNTTVADVLRAALVSFVGDDSLPVMGERKRTV